MSAKDTGVGKETERMVAGWLRNNGWPGAERRVRTGYRTATRESADEGDILGTPGICWQVKSLRTRDPRHVQVDPCTAYERAVPLWLVETEAQRRASGADLGFLVVRRWGTTDVGRWWVFQQLDQLVAVYTDAIRIARVEYMSPPVRMDMAALSGLLHKTGWAGALPATAVS